MSQTTCQCPFQTIRDAYEKFIELCCVQVGVEVVVHSTTLLDIQMK